MQHGKRVNMSEQCTGAAMVSHILFMKFVPLLEQTAIVSVNITRDACFL